jgi:hypothetical protein
MGMLKGVICRGDSKNEGSNSRGGMQVGKGLPPSFFDCQMHLLVHLVDEIVIAGPVHCQWMYWLERYMAILKGYVRNRARVEGSMATRHLAT